MKRRRPFKYLIAYSYQSDIGTGTGSMDFSISNGSFDIKGLRSKTIDEIIKSIKSKNDFKSVIIINVLRIYG